MQANMNNRGKEGNSNYRLIDSKRNMASKSSDPEDCPLCCETYTTQEPKSPLSPYSSPHTKIICSATSGCNTFHMCRLCVYHQAVTLSDPFVVDDETGDFCTIDPTACPQCKRAQAFVDSSLRPLSEDDRRREDEEASRRRERNHRKVVERMLRRLKNETRPIPLFVIILSYLFVLWIGQKMNPTPNAKILVMCGPKDKRSIPVVIGDCTRTIK